MRGPQGVWIQNGKLYVADTQNNRVLIYNRIPTSQRRGGRRGARAARFHHLRGARPDAAEEQRHRQPLLNPVSVTSDGVHLFVTDLGYNRVLIWNSIPT